MSTFEKNQRNQLIRNPKRGAYDTETIYKILDEALICHVGFVVAEQPYVIPTIHARQGDTVLLHGATSSRLMKHAAAGEPLCITVTLLDGLVLARSTMHHSMNYRSVVLFGRGHLVPDAEKMAGFELLTERLMPGRWNDARQPSPNEFKATAMVAVPIESASAKIRLGPPVDDAADYELPVWAGVIPIQETVQPPQADPRLSDGIPLPDYVQTYLAKRTTL